MPFHQVTLYQVMKGKSMLQTRSTLIPTRGVSRTYVQMNEVHGMLPIARYQVTNANNASLLIHCSPLFDKLIISYNQEQLKSLHKTNYKLQQLWVLVAGSIFLDESSWFLICPCFHRLCDSFDPTLPRQLIAIQGYVRIFNLNLQLMTSFHSVVIREYSKYIMTMVRLTLSLLSTCTKQRHCPHTEQYCLMQLDNERSQYRHHSLAGYAYRDLCY